MNFMLRRVVLPIFVAALVSGCGTTNDFRAYYNTFYNARRAFDDGYKTIEKKDEPINLDLYVPLFVRPSGSIGSRDFESAVVKSADVLRNHSDTKWVDDALLLIGKSYFYQENVVGALEKFREVIDRSTDLENEARFWLARTLVTSRSYEEARTVLGKSIKRENVPKEWLAMYNLALGELFVRQSLWEEAVSALVSGLKDSRDKETSARAQFLLGQVYEQLGLWEDAFQAYSGVGEKNPLYELSFAAKLSAGRVNAFNVDFEKGIKAITKLERDDKNITYAAQIKLVRGRALENGGLTDQAYMVFDDLLYGEMDIPLSPDLLGRVHYAIANYYREYKKDFVRAAAHFDSAATSIVVKGVINIGRNAGATQYAPEAIMDVQDLRNSYGEYARVYAKAERLDSLLWLGGLDQETFDAQIMEYRVVLREKRVEQRRRQERRQLEQQFRQSSETSDLYADRRLPRGKVIANQSTTARERAGFLYHRDPAQVEEGIANFEIRWGDRPLVSNWRRISTVIVRSEKEIFEDTLMDVVLDGEVNNALPEMDTSAVPRDSLSQAQMQSDRAIIRYDLGNSLFLAMEMPDSAAVLYRQVIEESGEAPVALRAFYALAEVQRALGDTLSANRLYDEILSDYPESDFAVRIRSQRGLVQLKQEVDLTVIAESKYKDIFLRWETGTSSNIIDDMLFLAASYPETDARAMALLAVGTIHLESAGADSVLILEAITTSLPDSILREIWPDKIHPETVASTLSETGALQPNTKDSLTLLALQDSLVSVSSTDSTRSGSIDLELGSVLADSASVRVLPERPDSLSIAFVQSPEPSGALARDPIFVEDLYQTVVSENAGTDYATHARSILMAVSDLRSAKENADRPTVQDSVLSAMEAASLRVSVNTDRLAAQDSLVLADSMVSFTSPTDSSIIGNNVSAVFEEAVKDSKAADAPLKDRSNTGVREAPVVAAIPAARSPGNAVIVQDGGIEPDRFPSFEVVDEDLGDEEFLELDSVKPLMSNGKPDMRASGWTIVLQWAATFEDAEAARREWADSLSATGVEVLILADVSDPGGPYRLSWGIFETKSASDSAIENRQPVLPDNYSYMLLLPLKE